MDYQDMAADIAGRMGALLQAGIAVTDDRGMVVAASAAEAIGLPVQRATDLLGPDCFRTPLRLDARAGEVLVARSQNGEELSPRLTQGIVDLVVSQVVVANRPPDQHILKNTFIHNVLHGLVIDETAILREASLLGLDLAPPRAVILIDAVEAILGPAERHHLRSYWWWGGGNPQGQQHAQPRRLGRSPRPA